MAIKDDARARKDESGLPLVARLELWKEQGALSHEQYMHFASLCRREIVSVSLELSLLLYAGVLAFVVGLGWTISTWSQQLGSVLIVATLSLLLTASFWYCFSRAAAWSAAKTAAPNPFFDYLLYLGSLVWCVELAYLENHFHVLAGQWDLYLLATALVFFFLAYRFDNRWVLCLALSSLAGWFGLTISHWPSQQGAVYRRYALLYCLLVVAGGVILERLNMKPHFFKSYLNVAVNVFFWTILSGVFDAPVTRVWMAGLLTGCVASLAWGLTKRQFAFVAYAAVYGYVGIGWMLLRRTSDTTLTLAYFVLTAMAMIVMLVIMAHRFGRAE